MELLQGRFSAEVMEVVTNPEQGLFPLKGEISFACDCPDWAGICKHVAAVFYGISKRLEERPELLLGCRSEMKKPGKNWKSCYRVMLVTTKD
ncbi:MAG: hypothetical protein JW781_09110 [Deltaproteobacteria bacterium]|nr:hypothetical protein [Candidatus Anaeroferrophillacea bacterium]